MFLKISSSDIIAIIIIAIIIGLAVLYIIKAKKSGQKCIGCPHSKTCASNVKKSCSGNCGCGCHNQKDENNE